MSQKEISRAAFAVLSTLAFTGCRAAITAGHLEPNLYAEVNDVLTRLGGLWRGGRTKAHVFPFDPKPLLRAALESGVLPPRNPGAYYPSPPEVVSTVMAWAEPDRLLPEDLILEPSAGIGALADAIREAGCGAQLRLVEVDLLNARLLRGKGYDVYEGDFLAYRPAERFTLVVMNPPFSLAGDREAYITHIRHAWELLAVGGRLVAITPSGFLNRGNSKKVGDFRQFVFDHGCYERLPRGAFRESGTEVETTVITLDKPTEADLERLSAPHDGYRNYFCYSLDVSARSSRDFYDAQQALYARIRKGRYALGPDGEIPAALAAEIHRLYEQVAKDEREQTGFLRLTEADYEWLAREFVSDYCEWLAEQSGTAAAAA